MPCGGLHCAGCLGGAGAPPVAFIELYGLVRVTEHLVEVVTTSAVCAILAVAAVMWLKRWTERHDAERAEQGSLFITRADAAPLPPPRIRELLTDPGRPALGFRDLHIHLDGVPSPEQAAAIRHAINGGAWAGAGADEGITAGAGYPRAAPGLPRARGAAMLGGRYVPGSWGADTRPLSFPPGRSRAMPVSLSRCRRTPRVARCRRGIYVPRSSRLPGLGTGCRLCSSGLP